MSAQDSYFSYLLRLWREGDTTGNGWRASLLNVQNGEEQGFRCLDELFIYLKLVSGQSKPDTSATNRSCSATDNEEK